jgi:hypothetical protein
VVFEGKDHGEPAGWLGAAAASRFCEYAAPALGGLHKHVRFPADLLNLPHHSTPDFPEDPFQETDARAKTIAEAQRRGLPYADGSVEATDQGFAITVTLRTASGREMGSATAKAVSLDETTTTVLDTLMASGAVPARPGLDAYVNDWFGPRSIREAIVDARLTCEPSSSLDPQSTTKHICATTAPRGPGKEGFVWRSFCRPSEVSEQPPPADDLGARVLYFSGGRFSPNVWDAERGPLAAEIARRLSTLPDASLRASALMVEEMSFADAHDNAMWEATEIAAAEQDPRTVALSNEGFDTSQKRDRSGTGPRVGSAWAPDNPMQWRGRSLSNRPEDSARALPWSGRWYLLAPTGAAALDYSRAALIAGRIDLVLRLAARLSNTDSPEDKRLGSILAARASAARGDLAVASERILTMLLDGWFLEERDEGRRYWLEAIAREIALLLGRQRELCDRIIENRIGDSAHAKPGADAYLSPSTCVYASREMGRRCVAAIRAAAGDSADEYWMLTVAERLVAGDQVGAVAAARRAVREPWTVDWNRDLLIQLFDDAKLYDLAEQLDRTKAALRGYYNGEDWYTVLRARRAFARGDRETGKKLARRIIDAWKLADAPVPAVAEMEAELAKP